MSIRTAFFVCAVLAGSSAALAADPPDAKCPPRPGMAMLAPEQRLMMFADLQKQAESGAVDVEMLRQMQRDKLRKMSADQRQAYFADLTKRWNALPPAEQKSLKTAAEKWRAEHPRPDGMHGGRPGCPPPEGH